jgi:signal transduction histidine kinase
MKLVNHTLLYLSGALFLIIGIWAVIFYYSMLDEVYDSIDDGLDNYKMLIIQKANSDSTILKKNTFEESNYSIAPISREQALQTVERYSDTLMYMQNEEDYEPVRILSTVFSINTTYYKLDVISSMVEEDDLIEDLTYYLVFLYLALLISIYLLNFFVLRRAWKPFYVLMQRLKHFNLKQPKPLEVPETRVSEFKELNQTILDLLKNNIDVYNSQKQFIENASHKLQTPLAISINKIELLLEENDLGEEKAMALSEVIKSLERLTRLNKSLLLLTKIENRQFADEEEVDFNELIKQQILDFAELLEFKKISVSMKENGQFKQHFNKDLAFVLVSNLLKNAMTYNVPQGEISIVMNHDSIGVANTGLPQALDPERIFNRFYRSTTHKHSTGLGLSIVKAITELYHMQVLYSFDGKHQFVLKTGR